MAMGARQSTVVRMILRQGIILATFGVAAGVGLNYGIVKLFSAFFGDNSQSGSASAQPQAAAPNGGNQISIHVGTDTFGDHGFVLLVLAVFVIMLIAAYIPARRASRVDPNVALRCE